MGGGDPEAGHHVNIGTGAAAAPRVGDRLAAASAATTARLAAGYHPSLLSQLLVETSS